MSKRKGLSLEEKRSRMLDLFYETKDFFLLKELEKLAPREKGIVSQSVKDVVQSLVDDNLVDSEKIGTSIYFWAFPSKATVVRKRKLDQVSSKWKEITDKLENVQQSLLSARIGKEDDDETRTRALTRLEELESRKTKLESELRKYKDNDPETLNEMKREIIKYREAANRWTDNLFAIQSWIRKRFPSISISDLNKQFGVPEDVDYLE